MVKLTSAVVTQNTFCLFTLVAEILPLHWPGSKMSSYGLQLLHRLKYNAYQKIIQNSQNYYRQLQGPFKRVIKIP